MERMVEAQQENNRLTQQHLDRLKAVGQITVEAQPPRLGIVSDFRMLNPEIITGTETPLQAEQWLVKTEQLLRAAGILEAEKIYVVNIQLTDLAHIWWKNEEERLGVEPATWTFFSESFLAKFIPDMA